jgi:alcohol dehydrogenase class IV
MAKTRRPDLATLPGGREFTWRDGERTIVLRTGAFDDAADILAGLGWDGFELLTTPRALADAPLELASAASAVHEVQRGQVAAVSAALVDAVRSTTLVALGGGRVIDTTKAIAAVRGARVAAIPTTLSGAEITAIHRLPDGHSASKLVRPLLAICDPEKMTSLPEDKLRPSAMNSLAHGAEALYTPLANPVASMAALRGAELLASALDQAPSKRDRAALASGSVFCAWALDSALFAIHHVICQTAVRVLGTPHAETNAAVLPRVIEAMRERAPSAIKALASALGTDLDGIGKRIEKLGGGRRGLGELGADPRGLEKALDAMLARGELGMTPDPPDRDELRSIIESAW